MKKLFIILLLLPFIGKSQSTQTTIQKQIDSSIIARATLADTSDFFITPILGTNGNKVRLKYSTITLSAIATKASNDVIVLTNQVSALTLQVNADKLTIVTLTTKIDALTTKIAAGLIVTGIAK